MARETGISSRPPFPALEAWPPDDTDESISGSHMHQTTIVNCRVGLNEAAQLACDFGHSAPWQALDWLTLLGVRRPDGSHYRVMPDVSVYHQHIDHMRDSVSVEEEEPPLLVIEVLSEATYRADLDMERGKGFSYARAGVREYLTIDPTGQYLQEGIRAWRLAGGVYQPWLPDAGRWQSEEIDTAFALEGVRATVYTRQGQRLLREGEVHLELAQRDEEIARQAEQLAQRDAEVARLRLLLDERRSCHSSA